MCTEAEKTFEKLLGAYQMLTRRLSAALLGDVPRRPEVEE